MEKTPKEMNKFECELCGKKHCISEDGFAINKIIQNGTAKYVKAELQSFHIQFGPQGK